MRQSCQPPELAGTVAPSARIWYTENVNTFDLLAELDGRVRSAVVQYWFARLQQRNRQLADGKADQGERSAVTGGAQMNGFADLLEHLAVVAGLPPGSVGRKRKAVLPGYFRPTKEWDVIVVRDGKLLAAIELKSQIGPSFGNNFNNRTEEALGSALDLWTAYREQAYQASPAPFLGYLLMIEDCPASRSPVAAQEPYFPVFPEYREASYLQRYELFCRKLLLERHYTAAALLTSSREGGARGEYANVAEDLNITRFARSLVAHLQAMG